MPTYTSGVFEVHPFKELQRRGEEIYSENLVVDGLTWRLKVYPVSACVCVTVCVCVCVCEWVVCSIQNGHHEDVGRYLAMFMELSEGYEKVTRLASHMHTHRIMSSHT